MYKLNNIELRAVNPGDVETLQLLGNDYATRAGLENTSDFVYPRTSKEVEEEVTQGGARFMIHLKGEPIGYCGIGMNWVTRVAFTNIEIFPDHRGNGYGKTVKQLLLDIAFNEMNARKATATVYEFNAASIKNLETAGYVREGVLSSECYRDGKYWDVYKYGLFKRNWYGKNGGTKL